MQLKSFGEVVTASKSIKSVIDGIVDFKDVAQQTKAINALKTATKNYSLEAVKGAIAQSAAKNILTKDTIKEILSQQGLQKELLETTADELANVVSTNAVAAAQKESTKSTNSFSLAFKGLGSKIKSSTKGLGSATGQLTTLPVGLMAVVAAIGLCVGGFAIAVTQIDKKAQKYIEKQQKIIDSTGESIEAHTEEISKLEDLKKKFDETASSGGNFANIYEELNDTIGATPELLKSEAVAIDETNAKLEDRLALLREEKELEEQKRKRAIREKYNNNVISNKGGLDPSLGQVRMWEMSYFPALPNFISEEDQEKILAEFQERVQNGEQNTVGLLYDIITNVVDDVDSGKVYSFLAKNSSEWYHISAEEFDSFLEENYNDALDYVSDIIDSYNGGIFTEDAIKDLIYSEVSRGETLLGIENELMKLLNNKDLHEAVDNFYASFNNPDIDTDVALEEVENQLDLLKSNYPVLKSFVDRFYAQLFQRSESGITSPITFSDIFALEDSNGELTKLGELSEQLDNIQNAYKTLSDAMNEYQTNGSYSVDTLQKIMELGDDWLDYLVDENGELKLDSQAIEGLASARLNEMKIRVQNSLLDQISQIKNEADANEFLASTNYTLADSISAVAKSKALEDLQNADLSDETYEAVVEKLEKELEICNKLFDNTSASLSDLGGTTMSSVMSSISSCADLISNVNKELAENGEISFDTLQSIAGSYPELEKYVNNYMGDVEGSQEALVEALNSHYQTELDNYYDYYVEKMTYDTNYWKNVYGQLPKWVQKLAETYKVDLANCSRYGDTKEKILENINEAQNKLSILSKVKTGTLANKKDELISYWEGVLKDNEALLHEIEAYFDANVDDLDEKFNNLSYISGESSSNSSSNNPQIFDWIETKVDRLNTHLDSLKDKADDVYSTWGSRTNALNSAIQTTTEAIELQRQAYNAYMKEADSVGLPEHYKKLVQNGALRIEDVDDSNIADQISEYQDLYEKAISCSDTVAELEQSLNELSFNTKWENIKTELDAVVSVFDADIDLIQTKIDALEIRGLFANSSYYTEMSALTQRKLDTLNSEAAQLKSILSAMPQDNEGYDAMLSELMDINKEIAELENNCIEFNNNIRDLDWEIFEYLEESINRITDETEYLIGLLENENLFDESGNFTEYADAALGLHSAAYETYKRQAQDYYSEVLELQKQLVDGAGQEVLEHYNEIVDAHRDAVSAAESEKQAILDLIEDGYDAQLDALQSLIDKKKEQLDTEKNLYDYRKSIAEKTANVSSLEKQMLAYKDDDSEEAMSRIQQLKVELEEAKSDLAETEYEQYLQDTEDMLDRLSEDYENWINARLDDEDALLSEIVATVADKGDQINSTLNEIAAKNGTFISDSIRSIFDADQPFATLMNGIKDAVTGVGTAIADLKNSIAGTTGAEQGANTADKSPSLTPTDGKNNTTTAANGAGGNPASLAGNSSGKNGTDTSENGSWGSWFVKKNDAYSKNKLNKDTSIVDRLKYFNIDPEFSKRAAYYKAMGGSGSYISSASQNVWMLNQMKAHGYKNGSCSAGGGWRWTQENGGEFILRKSDGAMFTPLNRGDMVFSNESSKRLYEFAENPEAFMKKYNIDAPAISPALSQRALENRLPSLTNAAQRSASVPINIGGINITCNEVNNARELMEDVTNQLIKNNRFGNAMSTMINNQIMGKNPLEHLKYVKH